jgi:hypothetical protein
MLRLKRKGQSTAEYAIVIGLVIAAAVAMQVYVKRSLQGKIKDAADYTDEDATAILTTKQYEPYYMESDLTSSRSAASTENTAAGGGVTRTLTNDTSSRTGTQDITAVQND